MKRTNFVVVGNISGDEEIEFTALKTPVSKKRRKINISTDI
jgi:hypothetical protein